jgi:hypothetical protein
LNEAHQNTLVLSVSLCVFFVRRFNQQYAHTQSTGAAVEGNPTARMSGVIVAKTRRDI